ncbi:MAG: glycoside hydrolase family 25 protein [Phyllobacteriaceae bacterium]|nr:glycoside hydrolase family 25 protein [Phyllobacteriaceae bacterium]
MRGGIRPFFVCRTRGIDRVKQRLAALTLLAFAAGCSTSSIESRNVAAIDIAPKTAVAAADGTTSLAEEEHATAHGMNKVENLAYAGEARRRFGDSDPFDFGARSPHHHAIHGVDVAKYQGDIDFSRARGSGVAFAWMKATEGGDRVDDKFADNWTRAKSAGVPRGAYHFYYFCTSAAEQARWFIRNVPRDASSLPPVLDMEWNPQSPSCKKRPPAAHVRSEMKTFLSMIERHYGKKPIVYTTPDFFEDNDLASFKGYSWWLRATNDHPDAKYDGLPWTFWQYTGTGRVPGITGDADINVFRGDAKSWRSWLAANAG